MEVFAALQVRALNLDLPGEALEAAVRLCARSGQWQKAVSILEQAHAQGSVSSPTTVAVFTTLLRESQPAAALRLLKVPSCCAIVKSEQGHSMHIINTQITRLNKRSYGAQVFLSLT